MLLTDTGRSDRIAVVWNCPVIAEIGPTRVEERNSGLRMLYHGSIVPERVPTSILRAMRMLPENVTFTLVGYETVSSQNYCASLCALAAQLGISDRFCYLGSMDRDQLIPASRLWDVGLALVPQTSGDANLQSMVGASNKPFDYLAAGLALLVTDLPDWNETFIRPGYALGCDPQDPRSIAEALRYFLDNPLAMRAMGERGRKQISSDWNYETQFRPVQGVLEGHPVQLMSSKSHKHAFDLTRN